MSSEPRAAYRLQLGGALDFEAAAQLVEYLAGLGVSHVYCSPVLQAAPGSAHGYDVVDPSRVSAELGGEAGWRSLVQACGKHELGLLVDVVPNHMATRAPENRWWWDVLENGPASRMARFFDVDWRGAERRLAHRILLPILPSHYGDELALGRLRLARAGGGFTLQAGDQVLPIAPRSVDGLLRDASERVSSPLLEFLAHAHGVLPLSTDADPKRLDRRHRHKEVLRDLLVRLCADEPDAARAIDASVARWNSDPELLHSLLERQNYRLAHWRTAARELSYRRFFDVADLVAVRVEDRTVFAETHAALLERVAAGEIAGLRVDHVDGLRDPRGYLEWLAAAAPEAWRVVEKILAHGETLPDSWPVAGTTGYDFLWHATGVLVDPAGAAPLRALYAELTGDGRSWPEAVADGKRRVLQDLLSADLTRLVDLGAELCESQRAHRDFTRGDLERALTELAIAWPDYRGYARAGDDVLDPASARSLATALGAARERAGTTDPGVFDLLAAVLGRQARGPLETELALRFQQLCAAVTAKGVEDTAGYAHFPLAALCEVGCDPGAFAVSPDELHAASARIQARWPHTLLASSTHDTKRSEDVRARLVLLSEIPERWAAAVRGWFARAERHRSPAGPDPKLEYLLYQTWIGAWPISPERLTRYLLKAAREAKEHTTWQAPSREYEAALSRFVTRLFGDAELLAEIEGFAEALVAPGRVNSLALLLLKLASPGVPDLYQGCELWDGSLVDPDNRRPIDFELRRRLLAVARHASPEQALAEPEHGLAKLFLAERVLRERAARPERFGPGSAYRPLRAQGAHAASLLAFAREGLVCAVPRLRLRAAGDWQDTALELPPGRHRNVLTGECLAGGPQRVAELLRRFPVGLWSREVCGT
ncbi:MAG TPA: malto-oligosyltrehalose synthase [Myxococcota bacterium]|nr:malto-oligosyltrehalose synthase [Myxococcota bacterium]